MLDSMLRHNLALDVGTASVRVGTGARRVLEAPSCSGQRRALAGGVVVDGEALVAILDPLLRQGRVFGMVKPRVLACAPSDVSRSERELLKDAILRSGAASVLLVPEPLAAAVGAGVDVASPYAQMVVDVGEGVTDCAVIRSGKLLESCALRMACAGMRAGIARALRADGRETLSDGEIDLLLRERGVVHRGVRSCQDGTSLAERAVEPVIRQIMDLVTGFLQDLPDALGCEVIESGIWLTGGGSLIPGLRQRVEEETGIRVMTVPNPREAVVEGARLMMPVVTALNQW